MKQLKKILAAALSGVLALAVLTGCSSGRFDKSEFIKQVGDYDTVNYQDIGEAQAAIVEDTLRQASAIIADTTEIPSNQKTPSRVLEILARYYYGEFPEEMPQIFRDFYTLQHEMFSKLSVDPMDKNTICYLSLTPLSDFTSVQFQNHLEEELAANVLNNRYDFCMTRNAPGSEFTIFDLTDLNHSLMQGTVSLKTITLDGRQYLLGVWKVTVQ